MKLLKKILRKFSRGDQIKPTSIEELTVTSRGFETVTRRLETIYEVNLQFPISAVSTNMHHLRSFLSKRGDTYKLTPRRGKNKGGNKRRDDKENNEICESNEGNARREFATLIQPYLEYTGLSVINRGDSYNLQMVDDAIEVETTRALIVRHADYFRAKLYFTPKDETHLSVYTVLRPIGNSSKVLCDCLDLILPNIPKSGPKINLEEHLRRQNNIGRETVRDIMVDLEDKSVYQIIRNGSPVSAKAIHQFSKYNLQLMIAPGSQATTAIAFAKLIVNDLGDTISDLNRQRTKYMNMVEGNLKDLNKQIYIDSLTNAMNEFDQRNELNLGVNK